MTLVRIYGISRIAFGAAALLAPGLTGRALAGEGGALPDARAFLRGMGGREIGVGLGALRADSPRPWLVAGVLSDLGDVAGIAGAWSSMAPGKRVPGIAMAGAAALSGVVLLLRPG
jgi:hypothetical protein